MILGTTQARCIEFCYAEDVGGTTALTLPQFYNIIHNLDPALQTVATPIENILFGAHDLAPNGPSLSLPHAVKTTQSNLRVVVNIILFNFPFQASKSYKANVKIMSYYSLIVHQNKYN